MKSTPHATRQSRTSGIVLALAVGWMPLVAAGTGAAERATPITALNRASDIEVDGSEIKSALAYIDTELERLERLADAAPNPTHQAEIKAEHASLKLRRSELGNHFTRVRHEAFKADLRAEMDKASVWAQETFPQKSAASRARPASARSALARLDGDIELLAATIETVPDAASKAALKVRYRAIKERRGELNREFHQTRYENLAADVELEWANLIH